ncbi:HAMP domain-containing sensor histidine kinase [Anaerosporobacter faecicola]|uniref:HAMP domain-containing sensor histidine kinase n=1 Tax=Anaerosporobacter faecicola TaxID=2718714 RepID=UPI001438AA7E|nr:HAMP domain-containing sensor histidine kinase [Anaerosporobacter faecicola]
MKHKLQLKFIFFMFLSVFLGIFLLSISEAIYSYHYNLTAEKTQEILETGGSGVAFVIGFLVVVVLIFLFLSRNTIKRIERLNNSIKQISKGNRKNIVQDTHKDELGELSKSICEMARLLEQSLEDERAMVCNIAHDLRTPVTSIQGYAQLLKQSEELSLQNQEHVAIIQRKSEHLSRQIEELLEYSILQFEEKEYTFESLSLSSLVEQIFIDFIPQLDERDMTFELVGNDKPHMFLCNQNLMIRLLENLLNNALRYGKKGKKIEAYLSENETWITLEIANYGSVLSPSQAEHIFQPFYQGEDAKEYVTQSKGLGLAIVSKIVTIHHGTIEVQCQEERKRTAFVLTFPKML